MDKVNLDYFETDLESKIIKMCKDINKNTELEVAFGSFKTPINLKKYNNLLKYLSIRSKNENLKLESITSFDILYNYDLKSYSNYRISINNIENINNFIQNNYLLKNHIIFSKQISNYINNIGNLILINKIRYPENFITLTDYDIRIRVSNENDVEKNTLHKLLGLDDNERFNIFYRYKQRVSLILEDNKDYKLSIDLTDVKSSKQLSTIINEKSNYELEIDISFYKKYDPKNLNNLLNKMASLILKLEQFLQESYLLTSKTDTALVIKQIHKLCYDNDNDTYKDIPSMQSVSVEIYHVVDIIPGNYTVSDKADGERYFLFIYNDSVYLISSILEIKKIKKLKNSNYNLTLIDGEYIYIPKYGKFIYLAFDILFIKGEDVRNKELLKDRLVHLANVIDNNFDIKYISGIYDKEYNFDKIYKFNQDNIKKYLSSLNEMLIKSKENNIICGKYMIFPMSISLKSDIYSLSTLIWKCYVEDTSLKCPYNLDGLIYTPINQKYTKIVRETKYRILKWKPESHNSIDFYILFERNKETNKILSVYDRTNKDLDNLISNEVEKSKMNDKTVNSTDIDNYKVEDTIYQIANLYVGDIKNNREKPVLFQYGTDLNQAYIYIKDGYPRDIEGNVLQDGTVVEFAFDNKSTLDNKFRWIPLRTRYDKTDFVYKYKRTYGNNINTANKVWESIKNCVKYQDIKLLGNPNTNIAHTKELKSKITSETIALARRDDKYFQIITNLAPEMKAFHSWIKSNITYTYCKPKILNNQKVKMDILDIGFGKGQDLLKLFHAQIKSAVCIDVNEAGFFSGSDGAISRYNAFKKKMPNFPKMSFAIADAGQKLDYENQKNMNLSNEENIKLLKQIFGENEKSTSYQKFDIINAQLMIHYLLKDKSTWNNLCYNINKYLKKDGYLLISTLDGLEINNKFSNEHLTKEIITENGEKKIIFDIIKKYPDIDINKLKTEEDNLGKAINVHVPIFMDQGEYITEYLVFPNFLINQLKTKCNMRLIETESFGNLYYLYNDFFLNSAEFESKAETRKYFNDVKQYYNTENNDVKCWLEYTKLHRYYIFQKLN
jgi:SAM-dependent methyltransferase